MKPRPVTVIGIGADGCASLSSRAFNAVANAQVLAGGKRHLEFFPQFEGELVEFSNGISSALDRVVELADENNVCVIASGDPMFFGIGDSLVKRLGAQNVEVIPSPSAMQWAFARIGEKWDDAIYLSVHGREMTGLVARLKHAKKAALFTDPDNTPAAIARHMIEYSETLWTGWVCENLAGPDELVRKFSLEELAKLDDASPLNILVLKREDETWRPPAILPYLPEDILLKRMPKKGLVTKREIRAQVIASLGVRADSIAWDIGTGSGSVAIEAGALASHGKIYAVERDGETAGMALENTKTFGADNVIVINGSAPDALDGLPAPDCVFIGGSGGALSAIIRLSLEKLKPGGRLVASVITFENLNEAYSALREAGYLPEVVLLNVSRSVPVGRYMRYDAQNPVHLLSVTKE
ncbi:Cobalt-precorrin-6y C5-methyltransferase / Cobalt-precorrin-6y C15-methyltransferase [decarboxylating] [hydrothermal vent metagenome]|uniref:Cobalt-precorrin-6y C5-methyltransferase / Cobalt-precorrin-6y C15-methyltransferase [decarboxylating] n=1 Tax=hydrothermal vent metagenome TaxID=652676 RepID=A0A3B1CF18_9ZZZZ